MMSWLSRFRGREQVEQEEGPIEPKEPIPAFPYHPHPLDTGSFEQDKSVVCRCCSRPTQVYYYYPFESPMISDEDVTFFLCPHCIKNGEASRRFHGHFQDPEFCEQVEDREKLEELCYRTPGYYAPEEPYWLAHCNDFCALIDTVDDWSELEERGIEAEVDADWVVNSDYDVTDIKVIKEHLNYDNDGAFQGFLFRCLHCGKHRLYVDLDAE